MYNLRIDLMTESEEKAYHDECSNNMYIGRTNFSGQPIRNCSMDDDQNYCNKCPYNYGLSEIAIDAINLRLERDEAHKRR